MTEDGMALVHNAACQASAKSGWQKYFRGEWIKLNLRWLCWWWTQLLCTISKSRQFTRPKVASHSTSKKRHEWNIAPKIAAVHKFLMKNAFNLSFFISISISTPTTGDVSLRLRPPSSECSKMKKKSQRKTELMKFMHFSAAAVLTPSSSSHSNDIMFRQLAGIASTSSVISSSGSKKTCFQMRSVVWSCVSQNKWQSTDSHFNLSLTWTGGWIRTLREVHARHTQNLFKMQTAVFRILGMRTIISVGSKKKILQLGNSGSEQTTE